MSRPEPLLLAIDLGTTALKCALYDAKGRPLAEKSQEYQLSTPRQGWVEMACETYWAALTTALAALWRHPEVDASRVRAIGISAQGETLVPVGRDDRPLRNAIVWLDNRAQAEADELSARFGRQRLYEITGQPEMLATWPAAKLLWLTRNEPEVAARTAKYLLIEDYLLGRLTGEHVTEGSLATSTCYWNFRTKTWWSGMLETLTVSPDQLPTVCEPGTPIGVIRAPVADELGLPRNVLVCTGALDQACGAIGAGNVAPGGFSENTGAAVALCATLPGPRLDPTGTMPCHYHAMPDTYMFHTFTSGGIVLRWFRDGFCEPQSAEAATSGADGYDILGHLAAQTPAGADGLLMLPHLQGAMAPENNDAATGVLVGMTMRHGRGHIVRAIMESIAFIVRRNIDVMTELGIHVNRVRALGGGARSVIWKQIEADVLGLPVVTMRQPDAGTLGAAILAGVGDGWWHNVEEAVAAVVTEDTVYEPNPAHRQLYDDRYGAYLDTYTAMTPIFDRLARASSYQ